MKKVCNIRPLVFASLFLALGVFCGSLVAIESLLLQILVPCAVLVLGIFLYIVCKKKFLLLLIVFSVGMGTMLIDYRFNQNTIDKEEGTVDAVVSEVNLSTKTVILSNVYIDGEKTQGYSYVYMQDGLAEGDIVHFACTIEKEEFDISDSYARYLFSKNMQYKFLPKEGITVLSSRKSLSQKIRAKTREILVRYVDEQDAGLCLTLLFADKSLYSSMDKTYISDAGISHAFAVSGLHVGFIVALLSFVLKKWRVRNWISVIICFVVLVSYGVLTDFPAGVVRATVAYLCFAVAPLCNRKQDSLNSLALAVSVMLILSPRDLFDISFLMSVGAVAGIIIFYPSLYRMGREHKSGFERVLVSSVATTVSASIFILPITFSVFGSFTPYAVLSNLIILPLITVSFVALFIVTLLSLCYSGFGILYTIVQYPVIAIRLLTKWISSLPYAVIETSGLGVASIFYILFFIFICRFFRFRPLVRFFLCFGCAVATVLSLLFL